MRICTYVCTFLDKCPHNALFSICITAQTPLDWCYLCSKNILNPRFIYLFISSSESRLKFGMTFWMRAEFKNWTSSFNLFNFLLLSLQRKTTSSVITIPNNYVILEIHSYHPRILSWLMIISIKLLPIRLTN